MLPHSNKYLPALLICALLGGCAATPSQREAAVDRAGPAKPLPQRYEQALTLMRSGDYGAAIPVLQRFSEDNPEHAGPWLNLGIAYARIGETQAALTALDKAAALNPGNAAVQLQRGILLRERGDFEAALTAYESALELQPDYALAHRNLGILYDLYLQRPALALKHYERYRALIGEDSKTVSGWIIDLERRSGSATASANP